MENNNVTIKIEIGKNLLKAIEDIIIDNKGNSDIGYIIYEAFGINFTKIVDNKFTDNKN